MLFRSGKIVDSVTNIMNAKLFARRAFERDYLEGFLDFEVGKARKVFWFMEGVRWFQFTAAMLLMVGIAVFAIRLWSEGQMTVGQFAMAMSLSLVLIEQARGELDARGQAHGARGTVTRYALGLPKRA